MVHRPQVSQELILGETEWIVWGKLSDTVDHWLVEDELIDRYGPIARFLSDRNFLYVACQDRETAEELAQAAFDLAREVALGVR